MKRRNNLANHHARQYIAAVFAEPLQKAGFSCLDDNLLCWQCRRGGEIINTIVFYTTSAKVPLFLEIGFGIFPVFAKPVYIGNVVYNEVPDEELFTYARIVENYPNGGTCGRYSDDIQVMAPLQDERGAYTLHGLLLPQMEQIENIQEAYTFHKNRRKNSPMAHIFPPEKPYGALSKTFISMALWVGDEEMYPYARASAEESVALYQSLSRRFPWKQQYNWELAQWKHLQEVLQSGNRVAYVAELSQRIEQNTRHLE